MYKNVEQYNYCSMKDYTTKQGKNQLQCVFNFYYSDESTYIEYNSHQLVEVNGEKYMEIIWMTPTIVE